ncbi:Phosphoglycerol transferase MdoB [Lachnospiraceae bacterium]|nr:Phosphoglycerol transferase MdoB [Lachnospiraceae bacterium]
MTKNIRKAVDWLILILAPALIFYATQFIIFNITDTVKLRMQAANVIFYELIAWLLIAITRKVRLSLIIELVFFWFVAMADAYVFIFRDSYIQPWDILSFGTAMSVANNFSYTPAPRMIAGSLMCAALFGVICFCKADVEKIFKTLKVRLLVSALCIACLTAFTVGLQSDEFCKKIGFHEGKFRLYVTTQYNGYLMGFLNKIKYLSVAKPEGYSASAEKEILESVNVSSETSSEDYPDIVVVMNEAFSDPAVDADFSTNVDYMPFIHSLQNGGENAVTGYVNVSVNGGNTPNSEFEFLTGHTMAFLPESSIAYQTYVNKDINAMPRYLKSLGYQTIGMHDYEASGWNREYVYPRLGFDETHFDEYFYQFNPTIVRDYISDASLFDQIGYELDNREDADAPVFSFSVSMQNHSAYDGDPENFERTVFVDGLDDIEDKYVKRLSNYLSLVKLSDEALQDFTEKLKDSDRKTIVVMFGDHQPTASVLRKIYELNGKNYKELDETDTNNLYRVPFIIWANYDIEERSGIETSLNYLGNYVFDAAGVPLNSYQHMLTTFEKDYPVVSAIRTINSKGESNSIKDSVSYLNEYQKLQYYELFDAKCDQ